MATEWTVQQNKPTELFLDAFSFSVDSFVLLRLCEVPRTNSTKRGLCIVIFRASRVDPNDNRITTSLSSREMIHAKFENSGWCSFSSASYIIAFPTSLLFVCLAFTFGSYFRKEKSQRCNKEIIVTTT